MDLYLRFEFESGISEGFTIENPPTVPCEGEIVDFVWEDFVEDREDLARVLEVRKSGNFVANILLRHYTKGYAEIVVALMTQEAYTEYIDDKEDYPGGRNKA